MVYTFALRANGLTPVWVRLPPPALKGLLSNLPMSREKGEFNSYQPELLWEKAIIRYIPRIALGVLVGAGIGFLVASGVIAFSDVSYNTYSPEAWSREYDNFVITHVMEIRRIGAIVGAVGGGIFAGYATYRKWV